MKKQVEGNEAENEEVSMHYVYLHNIKVGDFCLLMVVTIVNEIHCDRQSLFNNSNVPTSLGYYRVYRILQYVFH